MAAGPALTDRAACREMDIFDMLEEAHRRGRQVSVNWYYDEENERVADLAAEFKEDCSFPFVITQNAA